MQCCAAIYEGTQARITDYEDLALSRRVYVSCTVSFRLSLTASRILSMTADLAHGERRVRRSHRRLDDLLRKPPSHR